MGMSNSNPLLAKLALDNEAKKTPTMRANWSYEDVETKVWSIPTLTDFWGIGKRTEKRLNKLKIYSVKDLANANPDILKKESWSGVVVHACNCLLYTSPSPRD